MLTNSDSTTEEQIKLLRGQLDIVVRAARKERDYKARCKLNDKMDELCDELDKLLTCEYCLHTIVNCSCPF